jgi:hypothetical protein
MDYGVDEVGARNITELTDVELTNLANGEILKYNSINLKWENQPDSAGGGSLDALTDTNISSLINGQFLQYNSSNSKWENSTLTFTDTDNLVDLTDTNISSVANNELLKYNSSSSKWENAPVLINEIGDINITSLQNGEVLKYNSTSGKWENQDNTDTLNELTDVTLTGSTNNQVLKYNGSIWVNNFVNLTELADTNITTLNNGDILRYNSTSTKWETNTFNINDLDDVNITSLQNNEILKYNSTSGKWENSNRIDTLDELGDVTLTSVTTGDLLRYNGSNFVNTKIALDNDFTNVNFTSLTNGDLIKYNGSNFINFAPTYLDGAGIPDNYLIKVVGGVTTRTTFIETSTLDVGTSLNTYIPTTPGLGVLAGSIETEFFDTSKRRMHLTTGGIIYSNGITVTSDGRVGIGIVAPEENLEIDGSIQIDSATTARLKFQQSGQTPHALGEIDAEQDGTNGGDLQFYTKVDGASVTEKLRINNQGAIGIEGANFGTSGQVIVSNGSGSAVSWANQTDTTYSAGTGVTINGSNQISIGQSVNVSDSPSFTQMSLGVSGTNQGILNLQDSTNNGREDVVQIKGTLEGTNGGQLQIYTKTVNGSLTERLRITNNGNVRCFNDVNYSFTTKTIWDSFGTGPYHLPCKIGVILWEGVRTQIRVEGNGVQLISHTDPNGNREWIYCFGPVYCTERFQTAGGFNSDNYNSSDGRIKSREQPITNALETIKLVTGKKYEYHPTHLVDYTNENSDLSGVEHSTKTGVIAQELLDVPELSHLVSSIKMPTHPNTSIYSVCYEGLIPYLIESIKQLATKVEALENK